MRKIFALGWLSEEKIKDFSGETYGDLTRHLIGAKPTDDLIKTTTKLLGIEEYSTVIKRLEWLGLFSDEKLPSDRDNPLDYLNVITLKKMTLNPNERDMILMHHEFIAEFTDKKEYITSTLLSYGITNGDSAIARTVALPAAIAVKMIMDNQINITGNHIPVVPEIYNPILNELGKMNIRFNEKIEI